jgi:NADH-quinone oxidoreductase subunit G
MENKEMSSHDVGAVAVKKITVKIDGNDVLVPEGINLIEAAKIAGTEVPHYCYHPDLSIAGNCRMCQVEVVGAPKLTIACNTQVKEGMEIRTQKSSTAVSDAQKATLEFILINHPLDCTICDQAGHCKLQDYHFEYNAQSSRFLENKEHKPKAKPLGETVMLDAERCIACSRCVRFCDEVPGTSELGLVNRGDKVQIDINQSNELSNPFSGTVVDLCPVGALTHKNWRFKSRIWFTKQTDSICPGCSTGCNVKVATRDDEVVLVKARYNQLVNKEWMCDEGRYGFQNFVPIKQLKQAKDDNTSAMSEQKAVKFLADATLHADTVIFLSGDLTYEDYYFLNLFVESFKVRPDVILDFYERTLSDVERKLISPDRCPNKRGALKSGVLGVSELSLDMDLANFVSNKLEAFFSGSYKNVIVFGDSFTKSLLFKENSAKESLFNSIKSRNSVGFLSDEENSFIDAFKIVYPVRPTLSRYGTYINFQNRLQLVQPSIEVSNSIDPVWNVALKALNVINPKTTVLEGLQKNPSERDITRFVLSKTVGNATIPKVKDLGIQL